MKRLSAKTYARAFRAAAADATPTEQHQLAKAFLAYLRRQRVSRLLPRVLEHLQALDDEAHHVTRMRIVSAGALDDAALKDSLTKVVGQVALETEENSALIGGLTLRLGDNLIDASIAGRLRRLHTHLTSR